MQSYQSTTTGILKKIEDPSLKSKLSIQNLILNRTMYDIFIEGFFQGWSSLQILIFLVLEVEPQIH